LDKLRQDIGTVHRELCSNGTYKNMAETAVFAFLVAAFAEFDLPVPTPVKLAADALIARWIAGLGC
jgi:hypothetical protein